MKKIIIVLITGFVVFSCSDDFLDQVPDDRLTFEETFSRRATVQKYLANIYSRIPNQFFQHYVGDNNSGPWTSASDEGEYQSTSNWGNSMNVGSWDPTSGEISSLWSNFYQGIRASSTFINNIDLCGDCTDEFKDQYVAEARILRAYFYYHLLRTWGPVIILPNEPLGADSDLSGLERGTLQENVEYIISELDMGANALKDVAFDGTNAGRMSRPFAMVIKEKVLLFAASPLFNGNTDYAGLTNAEGENLIPQNYDESKWQRAANAAKAFIDEYVPQTYALYREYNDDGSYNPYLSTRNVMLEEWNEEIIYAIPNVGGGRIGWNYDTTPYHQGYPDEVRGAGVLGATQEMVDAFFTANGRSIDDPLSGYQSTGFVDYQTPYDFKERTIWAPWANREPRFYVNITFNNSLWLNRNYGDVITEIWYRGNSGKLVGGNDHSVTGYIPRKNILDGSTDRPWVVMRLAEIYLDYAEALNEYDPGNPDIMIYLNKIRNRAGIPEYGSKELAVLTGQAEVREAIHKERRVELAFESVRYFDVRRWKEAENTLGGAFHGLDILVDDELKFYNEVIFENRVFEQKHYLWPIPQDEINTNPDLVQNPGW